MGERVGTWEDENVGATTEANVVVGVRKAREGVGAGVDLAVGSNVAGAGVDTIIGVSLALLQPTNRKEQMMNMTPTNRI